MLEGMTFDEAKAHAYDVCAREGLTFVHPFDDADIIAGQGTIALEMLADNPALDTLVIPIGGGGLIAGIAIAAKALKPEIRIIGVQAAMYPAMHAALRGKTTKTGGATIAEGIAVRDVGEVDPPDLPNASWMMSYSSRKNTSNARSRCSSKSRKPLPKAPAPRALPPSSHIPPRFYGRKVGLVLCGGNIDTRLLASVLTRALVRENRLARIRIVGDDRPGLLALVSKIIGDNGANIMEVAHNRIALDVPAKGAEFDILMETRDSQHTQEVIDALAQAGYPPRAI